MKKKSLLLGLALVAFVLPTHAIVNGRSLTKTLKDLSEELQTEYQQRSESQLRFNDEYERQHQRMIEVVKESNELNILLYTQELDMTFDMICSNVKHHGYTTNNLYLLLTQTYHQKTH